MELPTYFVHTPDGRLEGYHRKDVLRCDLAANKESPPRAIFRLASSGLSYNYEPIEAAELLTPDSLLPAATLTKTK